MRDAIILIFANKQDLPDGEYAMVTVWVIFLSYQTFRKGGGFQLRMEFLS